MDSEKGHVIHPPFVKVQPNNVWTIRQDNAIRVEVENHRRLNWDSTFEKILKIAEARRVKPVCIDVGAFIGDSTRWFLNAGYTTYAFEPQPEAFLCLSRNCPEAVLFNLPVGNGERVLPVHSDFGPGNYGGRPVREDSDGSVAAKLDDYGFTEVGILKIDVEGWEPLVLRGAKKLITEQKPIVAVEFNLDGLEPAGFTCADIESHFRGWRWEEIFRLSDRQWDVVYYCDQ